MSNAIGGVFLRGLFGRAFVQSFLGRRFHSREGSEDSRQKPSQALGLTVGRWTRLATPNPEFLM
jgi:hypothetical protein